MTDWSVDLSTIVLLAGLVLIDGVRQVPAGAVLVRRAVGRPWEVAGEPAERGGWRLVSWLPPFVTTVVLRPKSADGAASAASAASADGAARLATASRTTRRLFPLELATLGSLVLGIPVAVAIAGGSGFLLALALVLVLAVTTALLAGSALRKLELPARERRWKVVAWCSPFAAPFAAEGVLEAAVRGTTVLEGLQLLLPTSAFLRVIRPRAYDHLVRGQADPELAKVVGRDLLEQAIAQAPLSFDATTRSLCPRCGMTSLLETGECRACEVPLERAIP